MSWEKLIRQLGKGLCGGCNMPEPPECLGTATGAQLRGLLRVNAGDACLYVTDKDYELTSLDEYKRFLKWYCDLHPYTLDEYDCDDFSWVMRAEALKWMHGKFPFGHIYAEGMDIGYKFPNHGFNFVIANDMRVYICDELEVSAPKDELIPIYPMQIHKLEV